MQCGGSRKGPLSTHTPSGVIFVKMGCPVAYCYIYKRQRAARHAFRVSLYIGPIETSTFLTCSVF